MPDLGFPLFFSMEGVTGFAYDFDPHGEMTKEISMETMDTFLDLDLDWDINNLDTPDVEFAGFFQDSSTSFEEDHLNKDVNDNKETSVTSVSRNLMSERRRRSKFNQSLYALRAAVPTVTKMDKASTVRDAIKHIKDLQNQLKRLEKQVDTYEECMHRPSKDSIRKKYSCDSHHDISVQTILKVAVKKMKEKVFVLSLTLIKQSSALVPLNKALETIQGLEFYGYSLLEFDGQFLYTVIAKTHRVQGPMESEELRDNLSKWLVHYNFRVSYM